MRVRVRLFSVLREHMPPGGEAGRATVALPDGASVTDLIAHLKIDRRVRMVVVNGKIEENRARPLQDGDQIKLFPTMVGG
jgi:molybdopterin converting factor small subunit